MSILPPGEIDHVAIAVHDLDDASAVYVDLLGARVGLREKVPAQGVEVMFLHFPGKTKIELIAPIDDTGAVARFLEKNGPGMHHVCLLVENIEEVLAGLVDADVPLVDQKPRIGAGNARIAFLHPRALGGVLLELKEVQRGS
jgi:methylmalonyl-CoA/ethylmalonyl-CoA epimerase